MKITNKNNLPPAMMVAAMSDSYSRGDANISVTQLIDAPRLRIMAQAYEGEQDVSVMLNPLLGTAFHNLMEQGDEPGVEREKRYFADRMGWTISGAIDRAEKIDGTTYIRDYKVTSVYTVMRFRSEWEDQLNLYRWLYHEEHGVWPEAEIVALCRDWRPMEKKTKGHGYPDDPIVRIPIKAWDQQETEDYVAARLTMHQDAQALFDTKGEIVPCTSEDRWSDGETYAIIRRGAAKASRVFPKKADALSYWKGMGSRTQYDIHIRPASERRCEGYCLYSSVCTQYQKIRDDRDLKKMLTMLDEKETS